MHDDSASSSAPREHQPAHPPGTLRVGRVLGVDVLVRASWLIIAVVIAIILAPTVELVRPGLGPFKYVVGVAFAVLLYLSVLLHELSHAVAAQRFGLGVRSIQLHFLGGVTEIDSPTRTPWQEFVVAVVGPLTSIAVGVAALLTARAIPDGLLHFAINGLAGANLLVGVLNLVPGLPLDGGRVLRAAVWQGLGNRHRGTIIAAWGGRVVAVLALGWPLWARAMGVPVRIFDYVMAVVLATFLWTGASAALADARFRRRLPSLKARVLARRAITVPGELSIAEALRRADEQQASAVVTTATSDRIGGIVNATALSAVPEERRDSVPIASVARTFEPGLALDADIAGEHLVRAMSRVQASDYLLLEQDGSIYGVLNVVDVDRAFAAGMKGKG